jgi:hypothetical protein
MLWILKGFLVLAKTRRGRKILVTSGLMALELAQHEQTRKLFAKARDTVRR